MTFTNVEAKRYWRKQIKFCIGNRHALAILNYAERLANIIEALGQRQPSAEQFLQATFAADFPSPNEITVLMYSFAIQMLARVWVFGKQVREWNNKRWNGTLLPFRAVDGVVMPVFVEDRSTRKYASIIGIYVEVARLSQSELRRLVHTALFNLQHSDQEDFRWKQ